MSRIDMIVSVGSKRHNLNVTDSEKLHRLLFAGEVEIFIHNDEFGKWDNKYHEFHFESLGVFPPTLAYDSQVTVNHTDRLQRVVRGDFWALKRVGDNRWSVIAHV